MASTERLRQAVSDYKNGNAQAFTLLYQESDKYIYTCIYKVMQGNDNAEDIIADIMQDTYVEASKSIGQLENVDCFLQWAGMIATRKCYAYLKKNKKYLLLNEEDDTFENLSDTEMIIPENVMQDKEKQRLVREIIDTSLTEMQRLCVVAYYFQEQKQSEIAKELNIPENTVKTNLSRAKKKIREGVLDLEKKDGTRLYSVAPLLLLLFKEDVEAAVVPEVLAAKVSDVVSGTGAQETTAASAQMPKDAAVKTAVNSQVKHATARTAAGKLALSIKARVVIGIIGLGAAGIIGGTTYAVITGNHDSEFAQEKEEWVQVKDEDTSDIKKESSEVTETQATEDLLSDTEEDADTEETQSNEKVTYRDVLSDTSLYQQYYPSDTDFDSLCFALADVDADGENELFIGDQYREYDEQPFRIINVLSEKDGKILDYDGNHIYDNICDFVLYSNGILESYLWDGWNKTSLWNLATGEVWEGGKYKPVEGSLDLPADERETHAYLTDQNGTVYEGEAGDEEYQALTRGDVIPLVWYPVTEENMTSFLSTE